MVSWCMLGVEGALANEIYELEGLGVLVIDMFCKMLGMVCQKGVP